MSSARRGAFGLLTALLLFAASARADTSALDAASRAPATRIELAPGTDGSLGAWLLLGPYPGPKAPPPGTPDASAAPVDGKRWTLASASEGPIDVKASLHARGNELFAYAGGALHVEQAGRYLLLVGADDGLRVFVDGKSVFSRDESRPQRDDDDMIAVDLSAGDHPVILALHQRDSGWAFKVRLLDATLAPPVGAYLALPGTNADDARALAQKLSWVSVDRGVPPDGGPYRPLLTVRFPEGAPRGVPLTTAVKLVPNRARASDPDRRPRIDLVVGEVPLDARGAQDLIATLPTLDPQAARLDDADFTYEVTVAGRLVKAAFAPRREIHDAIARASRALAAIPADAPWLLSGSRDSVTYLRDRLVTITSHTDSDLEAQLEDARDLATVAASLEKHADPYAHRTGPMRRALMAPFDDRPAPFGLYVPPSYRPGVAHRYPLIVGLHGLNGRPVAMLRYLFGHDEVKLSNEFEDRHTGPLEPLEAFVITPSGYGNTMYRDLGEDDALRMLAWALARYPIDPDRVTITGMSMGGIGAASIPLHHPGIFAAAEPLCGYHSYFVRRDIAGHALRPWEKHLAEERSNVFWSLNGQHLPLYVVHGTLDMPQENSGVLIKAYEDMHYDIVHEHPPLGHNVWQTTYEGLKGAKWLMAKQREAHPREVKFRTLRLRDGDDAWVHVDELAAPDVWGEVDARVPHRGLVVVTTDGVTALHLDRDAALGMDRRKITLRIDRTEVTFDEEAPLIAHREIATGPWLAGSATHDGLFKHGPLTGPIRDAFHEPLLFVYGASDPQQTRANEEVARQWAAIRWGVSVEYPVISDTEFLARREPLANDKGLFLVGNAKSNAVVRALEPKLPIRVEGDAVVLGGARIVGREAGAAFIRPNPERPDRYVVVVEGVDAVGTWRSLSLPDLIPDFVVYDDALASSRGQMILGTGSVRAAGFFTNAWELPLALTDPLLHTARPAAKSEYEATPYLP